MKIKSFPKLLVFIALPLIAGFIGSYFTAGAIDTWYVNLSKPALNPPNWVFAPVWTTLYILMGISSYLIWEKIGKKKKSVNNALYLFFSQLALNTTWSIIFFGLKNPEIAILEIVLLWGLILWTLIEFYKINKLAGYLLIPYLAWVSFATYLNLMIAILN